MQKLGILGGTFDPPHWGHLVMAEAAYSQMELDRVLWVPSDRPPHKLLDTLSVWDLRLEWVRRTIADRPEFVLCAIKAHHHRSSYAIDTLSDLQRCYPNSRWFWIVGLDTFQSLPRWYNLKHIASSCDWLVAPRFPANWVSFHSGETPKFGDDLIAATEQACQDVVRHLEEQLISIRWHILQMPTINISSSLIRHYGRHRRSLRYLVPEEIRTDLEAHLSQLRPGI